MSLYGATPPEHLSAIVACASVGVHLLLTTPCPNRYWTLVFINTSNVIARRLDIRGDRRWPNNDGVDIVNTQVRLHHLLGVRALNTPPVRTSER